MYTLGSVLRSIWLGAIDDLKKSFGSGKASMQKIEKPGLYYGVWGGYQLQLEFFMTANYWVATVLEGGKPIDVSRGLVSSVDAIRHIADFLEEQKGCAAMVGGKRYKLHDFLSFSVAKS